MPHTEKRRRSSNGRPEIIKRTRIRNGKEYTYWECQITTGYDDLTGKQKQRTISGKTQAEVRKKVQEAERQIAEGTYCKKISRTFSDWLTEWIGKYTNDIKPSTKATYLYSLDKYIIPALGSIKLQKLSTSAIQDFYNRLYSGGAGFNPLSPKTVKCIHGVVHASLDKAMELGLIPRNPSNACSLKKIEKKELKPLEESEIRELLRLIKGHVHENLYIVTLLTGLREGEVLGLTWDDVDFNKRRITVEKQLAKKRYKDTDKGDFTSPKSSKGRTLNVSDTVIFCLLNQQKIELSKQENAGELWQNRNLVFSNEIGDFLSYRTVYDCFKRIVKKMGKPEMRFHDLRHAYAFLSLKSGIDIKTLQENMGHYSSSFTLDVYGYSSSAMKESAAKNLDNEIIQIIGA